MEAMLTEKMMDASEALNFERAAEYRDKLLAVKAVSEKQKVVLGSANDMDLILTAHGTTGYHVILFYVRNGKLSGRESFHIDSDGDEPREEIIASFIKQYYTKEMLIPREIAVEQEPADIKILTDWLSEMRGARVKIFIPQKGEKHSLMGMARRDVMEMMKVLDDRASAKQERASAITAELNKVFGKFVENTTKNVNKRSNSEILWDQYNVSADTNSHNRNWRIEAYDISNTSGVDSVGAMVVFENGKPQRKDYRKFKIKTVEGPDDYSSMQEVIYRRFSRAQKGDPGFSKYPDLIFVDGGLGHVHAVQEVLHAMKENIIVAGMVKDDKHRTRGLIVDEKEIELREMPVLFQYVTGIQDEVHRFAIEYHHSIRNRSMTESVLDNAPGIGPKRKKALMTQFGSVENMSNASVAELADVDGMTHTAAEQLYEYLKKNR